MPKIISNALTAAKVKHAPPGRHVDGGGLQLLVKPGGARSWVYRFTIRGKTREIGLGPAAGPGMVLLAEARERSIDLRRLVKQGIDPLEKRSKDAADEAAAIQASQLARITFRTAAESYIAAYEASWKNQKHRQQWRNTLATYVYPIIGSIPVSEIETSHVISIIEPIWQAKPETAGRVRGRIEVVLDAAKARGLRTGENPARWRGHIENILPARKRLSRGHHAALPYERISEFVLNLRARQATSALALEFIILTAARSGEALNATWVEIDFDNGVWTVPAHRMKAGKEHRVPLTARALQILEKLAPLDSKYIFDGGNGTPLSNTAIANLIRRMHDADKAGGGQGYVDPRQKRIITTHGFRSTVRDWSDERTAYPHEMKEMMLAHTIANKAEAAYRRGDMFERRRRMMADWGRFCETPVGSNSKIVLFNAV